MTVKELMEELKRVVLVNPEHADYIVKMVGYDIYGDRDYDINIDDVITDSHEKILYLWD